jgi:hypothetical protein
MCHIRGLGIFRVAFVVREIREFPADWTILDHPHRFLLSEPRHSKFVIGDVGHPHFLGCHPSRYAWLTKPDVKKSRDDHPDEYQEAEDRREFLS